jgi:spore coat polysaccharide biosynthesis protein SpsF (cytidylyltransferase family)
LKEKELELVQKSKKDKEKAVEKVRAEMRNQNDSIKNENLKAKAEWQRDRKKLVNDHEEELSSQQKDLEMARDSEVRAARDKTEKSWRKRMDDREKDFEQAKN